MEIGGTPGNNAFSNADSSDDETPEAEEDLDLDHDLTVRARCLILISIFGDI